MYDHIDDLPLAVVNKNTKRILFVVARPTREIQKQVGSIVIRDKRRISPL